MGQRVFLRFLVFDPLPTNWRSIMIWWHGVVRPDVRRRPGSQSWAEVGGDSIPAFLGLGGHPQWPCRHRTIDAGRPATDSQERNGSEHSQPFQIKDPCYWEYNWIKYCSYFQPNCPSAKDELYERRYCCYSGGHYGCGDWQLGGGCCE